MYIILAMLMAILSSCTISFQNISTHGTASDVVDQDQRTDPDVAPVVTIPVSPL